MKQKTEQQLKQETELKEFLSSAVCRDGSIPTIETLHEDARGNITTIEGTITVDKKEVKMLWNVLGNSIPNNISLDLVTVTPFKS